MNAIKHVFKTVRLYNILSCKAGRECHAFVKDYNESRTSNEDGTVYQYPESFDVKFEGWSNSWYTFRVSDRRWIREGASLSGTGISTLQLMRRLIAEVKAFVEHCRLHDEARESNAIVYNKQLVQCVNIEPNYHLDGQGIFKITHEDGTTRNWYGWSADSALNNCAGFIKSQPVMIELDSVVDYAGEKHSIEQYVAMSEAQS